MCTANITARDDRKYEILWSGWGPGELMAPNERRYIVREFGSDRRLWIHVYFLRSWFTGLCGDPVRPRDDDGLIRVAECETEAFLVCELKHQDPSFDQFILTIH